MSSSIGFHPEERFHVWWRPNQPHEIHLVSSDSVFNSPNEQRPGLWVTFSCNPKSANYHPQNFNRLARALEKNGLGHPPEVAEHDRRLNLRARWIALWNKEQGDSPE